MATLASCHGLRAVIRPLCQHLPLRHLASSHPRVPSRSFHRRCFLLTAQVPTAPIAEFPTPHSTPPRPISSTPAPPPRSPASASSSPSASASYSLSDLFGIAFFLGLSGFTLYLGSWQLQRKQWKERLVAERTEALKGAGIDINALLQQHGNDWQAVPEFQRVRVSGAFDYRGQMTVGPRAAPATNTGLSGQGFYVITPCSIDGQTVLVNRGWVDRKHADRIPEETATNYDAVTHRPEKTPAFLGAYDPEQAGSYITIDAAHIAQRLRLPTPTPLLVDLISPSPSPLLHRRVVDSYLQFATTPLIHTVYAVTWFTLAAAGVAGTYIRFRRGGSGSIGEPVKRQLRQMQRRG